jgi:hypothetical protein
MIPLHFPIVIYPSEDDQGGQYTAHCLNMDLIADNDTVEGAVSKLLETVEAALEAARKHNANPFRDAPREYWDKLAEAQPLPTELRERILSTSRKSGAGDAKIIDIETQCDLRQLQHA